MAVKTKDEILNSIKTIIGENTDDNVLTVLEDVSDTFDDYSDKVKDTTDWKKKYEDNDAEWRQKYKDRFYGVVGEEDDDFEEKPKPDNKPKTFEDLFKKE